MYILQITTTKKYTCGYKNTCQKVRGVRDIFLKEESSGLPAIADSHALVVWAIFSNECCTVVKELVFKHINTSMYFQSICS